MSQKNPTCHHDEETLHREERKRRAASADPDVPSPQEGGSNEDETPEGG